MLSLMATSFAQNNNSSNNPFSIKSDWSKIIGYSYQPGYHYGISLAGGSFLSIGWAEEDARYDISATEYRVSPAWDGVLGQTWNYGYTYSGTNQLSV